MEIMIAAACGLAMGAVFAWVLPELSIILIPFVRAIRWAQRVIFGIGAPMTGAETLVGRTVVVERLNTSSDGRHLGLATIDSEPWSIRSVQPLEVGQRVTIEAARGAILDVRPEGMAPPPHR